MILYHGSNVIVKNCKSWKMVFTKILTMDFIVQF